tara:strand:+ start:2893 stop:10269 length:7377 start_codon:yes stop_codon:yes gene_type:complete
MADYDEEIRPQEPAGSAISKSLGQMALTMGLFIGGQALATMGYGRAKTALFKSLSTHSKSFKDAAKFAMSEGDSLTAFLSKAPSGSGLGGISSIADSIHRTANNAGYGAIKESWAGLSKAETMKKYFSLGKDKRSIVNRAVGAKYLKETAFLAPTFYALDQMVGHPGEGPHNREQPAWYNIPGHAVGFAKFMPLYLTGDAIFRGGGKLVGAGMEMLGDGVVNFANRNKGFQEWGAKTLNWFSSGKYLESEFLGTPLKEYGASLTASGEAFRHALGAGRKKLFTEDPSTMSGYRRTKNSLRNIYKRAHKDFHEKYDKSYTNYLDRYKKRLQRLDKDSEFAVRDNFDDFMQFMGTGSGDEQALYSRITENATYAAEGKAFSHKAFFNESKKVPFLARLLGLQRSKGIDYADGKTLGNIYDGLKKKHGLNAKDKLLNEKNKQDFIENIISKNTFINKDTGTLVDLSPLSPKYWTSKMLHSKPLVLGGKFSVADLFPFKVMNQQDENLHRIIPMEDLLAMKPSNQTQAFGYSNWSPDNLSTGGVQVHPNVYRFRKTPGLMRRFAGEKSYNIFDRQRGSWNAIATDVKAALVSDSPKLANVYTTGLIREGLKPSKDTSTPSDNPFISFIQRNFSLLDDQGVSQSWFSRVRNFMPDSFNQLLTNSRHSFSGQSVRNTLTELKQWAGKDYSQVKGNKLAEDQMQWLLARTNTLGLKKSKESFGETLSDDRFMQTVVDFLETHGAIKGLDKDQILSDDNALIDAASQLVKRARDQEVRIFGEDDNVARIITAVKSTGRGLEARGGIETPKNKIKRFMYEYAVNQSNVGRRTDTHIVDILRKQVQKAQKEGVLSQNQVSKVEFGMFADKLRYRMKNLIPDVDDLERSRAPESVGKIFDSLDDATTSFLNLVNDDLINGAGGRNIIDDMLAQTNSFETIYQRGMFRVDDVVRAANQVTGANPFIAIPNDLKNQAGLGMGWALNTVNNLIGFTGLGWDQAKYHTGSDVAKLWGKRLGAYALGSLAYNAADTFTDTSGLFDWTMFDEGITVGVADKMVQARMASGWVYDKMGIDNAARYMEGLMPGSTKVLPGAGVGFAMGGVKGAVIGGLANAYLQPQLAEGPLGFLAVAPPLAPFVTDMTKDFEALQDIYEGQELLPVRKGRGWTLGITPIGGGRIERYEPGWYPRLKAQFQASPELYGSKMEQFLAKDVPFVDFSLMDLVDPHYVEKKQYQNRPFMVPGTPFSEFPVVGPMLGATVGRLYNKLHPMAFNGVMHAEEAEQSYMKGQSYNWKGESMGTYGPQYAGMFGNFPGENNFAGSGGGKNAIMSPHNIQPLIGEQIYKGWIEPLGLPGFITSAMLWGGDEPFTNIPVAQSSDIMNSMSRDYWDAGLGDLMGTTELLRRAIPRPRTSYESVNFIGNSMPGWMPDNMRQGDPYCLTPETLVETSEGLKRADKIEEDMLLRTLHGRYFPVQAIKTREVNEDIYEIKIKGLEDFPIRVTGGHPFFIDNDWKFAKHLTESDRVSYPLLNITLPQEIPVNSTDKIKLNGVTAYTCGLLARWRDHKNLNKLREDTPDFIKEEIDLYLKASFTSDPTLDFIEELQTTGPMSHFGLIDLPILLNYLKPFLVSEKGNTVKFRVHNSNAAYSIWSLLLQNKIASSINDRTISIDGSYAVEVAYFLGIEIARASKNTISPRFNFTTSSQHGPMAYLEIDSIEKLEYKGKVYAFDLGADETFTVPGAAVHNSKIAHGELLLPGKSYESFFNPTISHPTGASRLGDTPYEQALQMIGLGSYQMNGYGDQEDVLEEGTAIHEMVQNQLMQAGVVTRVEALVADSQNEIRSYVDAIYRDPRTGQDRPLEIKSIGDVGLTKLTQPKWKHRVQLNSYLSMMGVTQGKLLYVSRDDPSQTKEFTVRFDPNLWESTLGNLNQAREMATEFLSDGYGDMAQGYSYLDRLRVLLNSSPYSREYRETNQLLEQQRDEGYLSETEQAQLSKLQGYHKNMMMKYQMYPRRFKVSDLLDPDTEYQNLSQNENIRPAADYNILERAIGSVWETATHLRSPIHTKLLGHYSPEEQYRNLMIRGDFASWTTPYESFAKPYARGLRAADTPLQGALSFGLGGYALGGGTPGAILGAAFGTLYGSTQGMYKAMTGESYTPDSFKDRVQMQEYFEMIKFRRAQAMYNATGDREWRQQMIETPFGWNLSGGGQAYQIQQQHAMQGSKHLNVLQWQESRPLSSMAYMGRQRNQAYNTINSPDRGFRSPYGGQDPQRSLAFDTSHINVYSGFSALPSWDRPFWTAFLQTPEDERDNVLDLVDRQMGSMLETAWGRGEDLALPNLEDYFRSTMNMDPSNIHPLMDPTTNISDFQTVTVENEGMNAHDFGMGWREQMQRINSDSAAIRPIEYNKPSTFGGAIRDNLSNAEIRDAVMKILSRMGYDNAQVNVNSSPGSVGSTTIKLNVQRTTMSNLINDYYGR